MEMTQFIGKRFSRLVCIGPFEVRNIKEKNRNRNTDYIYCKCDCGSEKFYRLRLILNGSTKSCGCYNKDRITTHKQSKTRLYIVWIDMKSRCYTPSTTKYHRYGGRGIKVCAGWLNSFDTFQSWALKNGYNTNLTIERQDNNKDYTPENCKWVSMKEQAQNKSNSVKYLCFGKLITVSAIAEKININRASVNKKLAAGMTVEEIIITHRKYAIKQPSRANSAQSKASS